MNKTHHQALVKIFITPDYKGFFQTLIFEGLAHSETSSDTLCDFFIVVNEVLDE